MSKKDINIKKFGFPDWVEFEIELSTAVENAHTNWEIEFTNNLLGKYKKYGKNIFLTSEITSKIKELQLPYKERIKK